MAKQIVVVDDITGEDGAEEGVFGWDGKVYRIDLTEEGWELFRQVVMPYVRHANEAGKMEIGGRERNRPLPEVRTRDHTGRHTKEEVEACRTWAAEYGIELPSGKGRIPIDVWEAHEADDVRLLRPGRLPDSRPTEREQTMLELEKKAS